MKGDRTVFRAGRHEQRMNQVRNDTYQDDMKYHEPTACPQCGATYIRGRWTWAAPPEDAVERICPACQRIQDDLPAGYVTLKGAFALEHRDELLATARGCETREKAEHPLQRIMNVADVSGGIQITTTDVHLARGITEALCGAFKGKAQVRFAKDEHLLRATWERAA